MEHELERVRGKTNLKDLFPGDFPPISNVKPHKWRVKKVSMALNEQLLSSEMGIFIKEVSI